MSNFNKVGPRSTKKRRDQSDFVGVKKLTKFSHTEDCYVEKRVSICAALLLAAAVFADSAEARQGFSGARMGGSQL